ncbi:MAG: two-component system phosphate regulon sensor histidine kinase PhoR [Methylophilaceae bacterium]
MSDIRWETFWLGLGLLVVALVIWAIKGMVPALVFLCIALSLFIAQLLYWLYQLQIWLKTPSLNEVPEGKGVWETVFSSLFQHQRQNIRVEAELVAALEGFKRATNALPDGIVVLNHRDEVEWCNPPAELLLGLDINKDINQPVQNLVRYAEFINYLQSHQYAEPIIVKSIRNTKITLQMQVIVFGTAQKLLICRNISAQEKIDTMRRDFIANVSHELRTPLTVVGGFLETLLDTKDAVPDSSKGYFDMMIKQTTRMRLIIEDLLTLSRIESNSESPTTSVINMSTLLIMLQNDAKALSNGKHEIHLNADETLNIKGNNQELVSAFTNLVTNAVRYTPEGGNVTIGWTLKNEQAVFIVKDSGIGIEAQHIVRLTERFYRVDNGRSRDTGGTGLGLAIVKHILNRHKARLEIKSTIGEGSTFNIVFPQSRTAIKPSEEVA